MLSEKWQVNQRDCKDSSSSNKHNLYKNLNNGISNDIYPASLPAFYIFMFLSISVDNKIEPQLWKI